MDLFRNAWAVVLSLASALLLAATLRSVQGQSQAHRQRPAGDFLELDGSKIYYEECGTGREATGLIHDGIAH